MRSLALFTAVLLLALDAHAIVMRHDRPAQRYIELGAKYPAAGTIGGRVACVLIAPRWALGAGHTIESYFNPLGKPWASFGGKRYEIDRIIVHPKRVLNSVDSDWDLALFRLAEPVEGIAPVLLYEGSDEMGKVITFVGPGAIGKGNEKQDHENRPDRPYGARNRVEGAFEHSLVFTFSPPPEGEDLEGIAGAGDSGCPALLEENGKVYTLGVGSWNSGDEAGASRYGTVDAFARVSAHREWIRSTMAADPPSTVPLFGPRVDSTKVPETPAGIAAVAILEAFNTGKTSEIAKFYEKFGRRRPAEEIARVANSWQELIDQYGRYELQGYTEAGPYVITLLVRSEKAKINRALAVILDPEGEHRVKTMRMADRDD